MTDRHWVFPDLTVSRETTEKLSHLVDMLRKWSPKINLVAQSTLENAWTRHILDSVQAFDVVNPKTGHWVDFGSGGGFPGLVVAILAQECSPGVKVTLVESDQRKCVFLKAVLREVRTKADVLPARIESLDPLAATYVSARALAGLSTLLTYAKHHLSDDGVAVFLKGAEWKKEVATARESWNFTCNPRTSVTDPNAVVLTIGALTHV
ncbi:16S rRNA methyltransferase [Salipiger aestuarii]|uniref:16S rRNA (guanine(527)-N(7))-methyltransferase RsmG n=1 Tax=Salipiger aestuarii TaxID=568098 RepID=UPI0012396B02|nr:16S rRNA (guanine(527)-N(7))-methyltransferase RsmG [Salipiger aestuarii]KAA8609858.1 16S rRNA methyltransferase [Salipiger aestuarii]